MSVKHKVTLKPEGKVVEVEEGVNLLKALRETGDYVKSSCGGHATCSDCIIKVVSGEDYLTPPPFEELKILGNVFHITKERLACQTCITGDVTIDISKHDKASDEARLKNKTASFSKKKQTVVRKESDVKKIYAEKEKERQAFDDEQKTNQESWQKHWEKTGKNPEVNPAAMPKRLAGGKRPKFFNTDKVDYENDTYTRPLSAEKQKLKDERLKQQSQDAMKERGELLADDQIKEKSGIIEKSDKDFKKFR